MDERERRAEFRRIEAEAREHARVVIVAPNEVEQRHFDDLVAALATLDFEAFEGRSSPLELAAAAPEQIDLYLRGRRLEFDQFAGKLGAQRKPLEVTLFSKGWRSIGADFASSDSGELDIRLWFNLLPATPGRFERAFLRRIPTERPIDPADRAEIDRLVKALQEGDWEAYSRYLPAGGYPMPGGRIDFDTYGPRAGTVRSIRHLVFTGDLRFVEVVFANRDPGGQDLTLHINITGRGDATRARPSHFVEEGFDASGRDDALSVAIQRHRAAIEERLVAAVRVATKAARLPTDDDDDAIRAVVRRWCEALAEEDYQAALNMVIPPDGWSADELRNRIATLDAGPDRPPAPHRVTATDAARMPAVATPEKWAALATDIHIRRDDQGPVTAQFTLALDGFWSPFFVVFELIDDREGMWVLSFDAINDWRPTFWAK